MQSKFFRSAIYTLLLLGCGIMILPIVAMVGTSLKSMPEVYAPEPSLLPTTLMGRHAVGFNYTAIGIENVGSDENQLTLKQAHSNAKLINYLIEKHPSIYYLVGHMEYMNQTLPHFPLYKAHDLSYEAPIKMDPGWTFMKKLRSLLKQDYNLTLNE